MLRWLGLCCGLCFVQPAPLIRKVLAGSKAAEQRLVLPEAVRCIEDGLVDAW